MRTSKLLAMLATIPTFLVLTTSAPGAAVSGCAGPPFAPGNWPGGCYQPFQTASVFAQTLPPRESLVRHSAAAVTLPVTAKPGNLAVNATGAGPGEPVYYSKPTDPLFTLSCVHDEYNRPDHSCPIDTQRTGLRLHIPAGARPEGNQTRVVGSGPAYDAHLIVVDSSSGWEYDFWQVQSSSSWQQVQPDGTVLQGLSASGGHLEFAWGGRIRINGDGTAAHQARADGIDDANAAHWAESAARVRAEELSAGVIGHALWLNVSCTANVPSVYPADVVGRAYPCSASITSPLGSHPLGTRFWLDMTAPQIAALPVPAWKKTILTAFATYGGFVGDTNADPSKLFYIETEAGNQYSSLRDSTGTSYTDRWWTFAQSNAWEPYQPPGGAPAELVGKLYAARGDSYDWQGQVWSHLKVLDTCLTPEVGAPCS